MPIWSLPERGQRGPKPRYSRAAIAAVAVRIADAEGIDAVTMRRVAGELGVGTMSLYNYVPTKDHLIQLMIDQAAGEYAYPSRPPARCPSWPAFHPLCPRYQRTVFARPESKLSRGFQPSSRAIFEASMA